MPKQGDVLTPGSFNTSAIVRGEEPIIGGEMTGFFSVAETCGRAKEVEREVCEGVKAVEGTCLRF